MIKLSQKNSDIAILIYSMANGLELTKIDNGDGIYEPVFVKILSINENWCKFSVAYGFLDDDGMFHSDPEVHLLYLIKYGQVIPYYLKTGDGDTVIEKKIAAFDTLGRITWEADDKDVREVQSFASSFLKNLEQQQNLSDLFDKLNKNTGEE